MDDHQTVVLAMCLGVFADDRFEVGPVVGDDGTVLPLSDLEEVGVAETAAAGIDGGAASGLSHRDCFAFPEAAGRSSVLLPPMCSGAGRVSRSS